MARRLHGNVFVLAKIDARVCCAEQLQLDALVTWQWNGVVDFSSAMAPLASEPTRSVVVVLLLLGWLLPAIIDCWLILRCDFSTLLGRRLLVGLIAEARIRSTTAREGARTTAIVPISTSALRRVSVLITVIVVVARLMVIVIVSSAASTLEVSAWRIVVTLVEVGTTIIIPTN